MRTRTRTGATAALGAMALAATGVVLTATPAAASEEHSPARMVAKITGPGSINDTDTRWDVGGTDLGLMWDNGDGQVLFAIGDTFATPPAGGPGWRSNGLLRSADTDFTTGMLLDSAVEDDDGDAAEIIPSLKEPGTEHTTIPTAGIAVDGRQYLAFMSVRQWGPPGEWDTNYSRIAYSDDNGETWNHTDGPEWTNTEEGDNNFQMVSFVHGGDDFVYMHGTPNGRLGAAQVARVPQAQILDKDAYTYWDGQDWVAEELAALDVVDPNVSELSVQYHDHSGRWLMMYLNEDVDVVVRTAPAPQGPWSEAQVVASFADYPGLYSPYMHPWNSGPTVHFMMSLWDPYNIYQLAFDLDSDGQITRPNLIADPSFERAGDGPMSGAWSCIGPCGIDRNINWAHSGSNQAWMRHNTGWIEINQQVDVEPYTTYDLSAFITTGGAGGSGVLGVRQTGPGGQELATTGFTDVDGYDLHSLTFNSGPSTTVEVYIGSDLEGDRWIQLDDVTLIRSLQQDPVWELGLSAQPAAGTELTAGDALTYTIEALAPAAGISGAVIINDLRDVLDDAELGHVQASAGQPQIDDGVLTWTGDLVAQEPLTISYQVTVADDGVRTDSVLANTVSGTAEQAVLVDCPECWSTEHTVADGDPVLPEPAPEPAPEPDEDAEDDPAPDTDPGTGDGASAGPGGTLPETGSAADRLLLIAALSVLAGLGLLHRRRAGAPA